MGDVASTGPAFHVPASLDVDSGRGFRFQGFPSIGLVEAWACRTGSSHMLLKIFLKFGLMKSEIG